MTVVVDARDQCKWIVKNNEIMMQRADATPSGRTGSGAGPETGRNHRAILSARAHVKSVFISVLCTASMLRTRDDNNAIYVV